MAHLGARRVGSGWRLCEGVRVADGGGWEGSPAGSVPRRPEEATGGDPRRQRGPSGCYRYPLIVNGSPRRATGRLRVALCEGVRVAGGGGWEGSPAISVPRRPEEASGGDLRRQRGPSGCYRYPLIVNGSPWRAMGRPRVAFTRGGSGSRWQGVGRLTGRQGPKTTRGGHRWRSVAAERSVGMLPRPPDSEWLTSVRDGWAPGGVCARGIWKPAAGGGKAHRPSVSQDDPRRLQVEIRSGREVRRDAIDTP